MTAPDQRDMRDRLGEAARRYAHGLVRPLWHDLAEERREEWRRQGDVLANILRSVGVETRIVQ